MGMNWNNYGKANAVIGEERKTALNKKVIKKTKTKKLITKFPSKKFLRKTKAMAIAPYINRRCNRCHAKTVGECLGMKYKDANGIEKKYGYADLQYDLCAG